MFLEVVHLVGYPLMLATPSQLVREAARLPRPRVVLARARGPAVVPRRLKEVRLVVDNVMVGAQQCPMQPMDVFVLHVGSLLFSLFFLCCWLALC